MTIASLEKTGFIAIPLRKQNEKYVTKTGNKRKIYNRSKLSTNAFSNMEGGGGSTRMFTLILSLFTSIFQ